MGYAWVAVLHVYLQLSYTTTLLVATVLPGLWLAVFHALMRLSRPAAIRMHVHYGSLLPLAADGKCLPVSSSLTHTRCCTRLQASPLLYI